MPQAFSIKDAYDYIDKQNEVIAAKNKQNMLDDFSDLTEKGIISKDMDFDQMKTIVEAIENPVEGATPPTAQQTNRVRAFVEKRFSSLYSMANSILQKGEDG